MSKQPLPPMAECGIRWLWITVTIIALDQLTKYWIVSNMELYESINVLPVFDIFRTFNTGAAWSVGENIDGARWGFTALAVVVSVVLVIWLRRLSLAQQPALITGITLILGGAIGNVIDRIRLGHVIDFLSVYWNDAKFPAFNVADAAITIGAALVIWDAIREGQRERAAAQVRKP